MKIFEKLNKKFKKKDYEIFIKFSVVILLIFVSANFLIYNLVVKNFLTGLDGDLSRLGYFPIGNSAKEFNPNFTKNVIKIGDWEGEMVDILTIGDSFSQMNYQNYLSSLTGLNVVNIPTFKELNSFETFVAAVNNGYIERLHPQVLIYESVQRYSSNLMTFDLNVYKKIDKLEMINYYERDNCNYVNNIPTKYHFINKVNFSYLKSLFNFYVNKNLKKNVFCTKLDNDYFTNKYSDILFYYNEDVEVLEYETEENMMKLNNNLNTLSLILKQQGVEFYYMPVVDKYTLYRTHFKNNSLPTSKFFEKLRLLPRKYVLIDTQKIFQDKINSNVKDLYKSNDTHWSNIAQYDLALELSRLIKR